MSSGTLADGTVFAGRYRIVRCIATGGMGSVYEVVHLETERHRALKVLHPQFLHNDDLRGHFRREARVAAKVESRHIVEVFDAGIDEATGMPFLVMEFLRGEEIGKRLKRVQRFTSVEVLAYLHQTALALDKTHRASIVHRDLKPDNLFLCEHDEGPPSIKVLDFGIAKLVAEGSAEAQGTRSLGTPMYMAPEQFRSAAAISPATDIFALGMIAYTLLVGSPYWIEESKASGNVFEFVGAAAGGPREPPNARALRRGVTLPPAFDAWFARTTAFSPADRFPSASAAVQALAYVLGLPQPGQDPSAVTATGAVPARSGSAPALPAPAAALPAPAPVLPAPAAALAAVLPAPAAALPRPGARLGGGTAVMSPSDAAPARPGHLPAGSAAPSTGVGAPWVGAATPPAGHGASSRGSSADLLRPATSAVQPIEPRPVVAASTDAGMIPGGSPAAAAVGRRRSMAAAAAAIAVPMLLVGGGAVYYTVRNVLSPRSDVPPPTEPAAASSAAASETPEPRTAPSAAVEVAPVQAGGPATVESQGAAASASAPHPSAPAPVSAASTSSPGAVQPAARPTGTAPPATKKKTGSIHSRD